MVKVMGVGGYGDEAEGGYGDEGEGCYGDEVRVARVMR